MGIVEARPVQGVHNDVTVKGVDVGTLVTALSQNLGFALVPVRGYSPQNARQLVGDEGGIGVPEPFVVADLYRTADGVRMRYDASRPYVRTEVERVLETYGSNVVVHTIGNESKSAGR